MSNFPRVALALMNVSLLIYGVYNIVFAAALSKETSVNPCLRYSKSSFRWTGATCCGVAVVGLVGAALKLKALQCVYLWAFVASTAIAVVRSVFVAAIMPGMNASLMFSTTAERGNWLPGYGTVIQKTVANSRDWNAVKSCFRRIDTCGVMAYQTMDQKVDYIDYGCCLPPNRCGLEQASTGLWVEAPYGLNSTDPECREWAQVGETCYECDSCMAAYLGNFHNEWDKAMTTRIMSIIVLMGTSTLAYYNFINDHHADAMHGKLVGINV